MVCAVQKPHIALHACNDIHGTGVILALDEQDVRLYCCMLEFAGVIIGI